MANIFAYNREVYTFAIFKFPLSRLSLWRGLAKCGPSETLVVEREVVWTIETNNEEQSSASSVIMPTQEMSEYDALLFDGKMAVSCNHGLNDEAN